MFKRIYIEITNICGLQCAFCTDHTREARSMTLHEFEHVLMQVSAYTQYIYLHVLGEPMLHPDFSGVLDLCDQYHMHVQLVANGSCTEQYDELFRHPCIRRVSFSLQSLPYQPAGQRDQVFAAVRSFIAQASSAGRFVTELRFWADTLKDPQIASYEQELRSTYPFSGTNRKNSYRLMPNVYVSYEGLFVWPDPLSEDETVHGRCHGGIDQLAVLSNGTVVPCCLDAGGRISLGNIFDTPLAEILKTPRYISLTEGFRSHRITEDLCRRCTYRRRFKV